MILFLTVIEFYNSYISMQYLRKTKKLMRQLQGMNIKSMLVLKIISIVSKYKHWIKNCLAFLPSEFLIDNQIINTTKIGRTHVRAVLLLVNVLIYDVSINEICLLLNYNSLFLLEP